MGIEEVIVRVKAAEAASLRQTAASVLELAAHHVPSSSRFPTSPIPLTPLEEVVPSFFLCQRLALAPSRSHTHTYTLLLPPQLSTMLPTVLVTLLGAGLAAAAPLNPRLVTLDPTATAEAQPRDATATRAFSAVAIKTGGQCLQVVSGSGDFRCVCLQCISSSFADAAAIGTTSRRFRSSPATAPLASNGTSSPPASTTTLPGRRSSCPRSPRRA
jgi:hypothetical protein